MYEGNRANGRGKDKQDDKAKKGFCAHESVLIWCSKLQNEKPCLWYPTTSFPNPLLSCFLAPALKAAVAYGSGPVCSPSLQGHHNMHTHLRVDFHFSQISSGLNLTFQRTWLRSHSLLWSLLHNYPSPTLQKLGMAFTCPPELQRSLALEHSRVLESVLRI